MLAYGMVYLDATIVLFTILGSQIKQNRTGDIHSTFVTGIIVVLLKEAHFISGQSEQEKRSL